MRFSIDAVTMGFRWRFHPVASHRSGVERLCHFDRLVSAGAAQKTDMIFEEDCDGGAISGFVLHPKMCKGE